MINDRLRALTLLVLNALMLAGVVVGFTKTYGLVVSFLAGIKNSAISFVELIQVSFHYFATLEQPIFLGILFCAGVITYDLSLLFKWMWSFKFTKKTTCAKCSSKLIREERRTLDRYLSKVIPLKRYRCVGCGQEYLTPDAVNPGKGYHREIATKKVSS